MTATFKNAELEFLYPENWKLQESYASEEIYEVALESPDGCIWSVSVFLDGSAPAKLTEMCAEALKDQYEDFERFDWNGEIAGLESIGFDSNFFCLDFIVAAQSRAFRLADKTLNVFCQAEMRDFEKNEQVFEAITTSLIRSLQEADG